MKKLLCILQYLFAIVTAIYVILMFTDKSIVAPMAICAVIFGTISLLLFIKRKKGYLYRRKSNKQTVDGTENVIVNEQSGYIFDETSNGGPAVSVTIKSTQNFPKYSNENTDIPADTYIYDENGKCIGRADGQLLNEEDCAYMMHVGYEQAKKAEQQSINPKFHRTPAEKELEFQFANKYMLKSQKICDVFCDLNNQAYLTDDLDEKLNLLQACIRAFDAAKEWHYKQSAGAKLWFQDNWEYCHNSQNACFSWIDSVYKHTDQIIKIRDVILPWILENAETGFLQTEIYKTFPEEDQTVLRNLITKLAEQNTVQKTKKGNTYFIHRVNIGDVQNEQK